MQLQFYTPRERSYLSGNIPPGGNSLNIERLKEVVARKFPNDDWDRIYFVSKVVGNALVGLANMNTCHRDRWEWYVPKTPQRIFIGGEEVQVCPVAHSMASAEMLNVIWGRPRREIIEAVAALQEAGFDGLKDVSIESEDINRCFLTLSWHGEKFPTTRNVIYLHKGSLWRGKR